MPKYEVKEKSIFIEINKPLEVGRVSEHLEVEKVRVSNVAGVITKECSD